MLQQAKPVAKRERRARRFKGVHPSGGKEVCGTWYYDGGYVLVGAVETSEAEWVVYRRPTDVASWGSVRVIAKGSVYDKASYWLTWNDAQSRFGRSRDAMLLVEHRPELKQAVAKLLTAYFVANDLL